MKKVTLLIALFVCAIGFSQTGSATYSAENSAKIEQQAKIQLEKSTPVVVQRVANYLPGESSFTGSSSVGTDVYNSDAGTASNATRGVDVIITHSNTQTIEAGAEIACAGASFRDNSLYRDFDLTADFGITTDFVVTDVEFAIGLGVITPAGFPVTVNIYSAPVGSFPDETQLTLQGTAVTMVFDTDSETMRSVPLSATIPAGEAMIYEVMLVDDLTDTNMMRIGANNDGQTGISWIKAVDCGAAVPTDLAALGLNNSFIMNVIGDEATGGGDICADPVLEINQDFTDTCMANQSQTDLAQSFQPVDMNSAGAGFFFTSAPLAGEELNLFLYDALPNNGGVILASGTGVADGTASWVDVLWDVTAVVPGDTYFIVMEGTVSACYAGSLSDVYPGGMVHANAGYGEFPGFDYTFRTYSCAPAPPVCNASEDFEAGVPAGWSSVINTGLCDWANSSNMAGGTDFPTLAMTFDDDACGNGADASNVSLLSDIYDTDGATSATLGYDYGFVEIGSGETLTVEVYDGAAWVQVALYDVTVDPAVTESIDVTAEANADFQVRWTYDDAADWAWSAGVDNFCLSFDVPPAPVCAASEDFEAGVPAGWSTVINAGLCDWANSSNMAGGTDFPTLAMTFDDDACGNGADPSNVSLLSDVYNTNGATAATLDYDYGFVEIGSGETLIVEVYDGAAWVQVALYDVTVDPAVAESIDVTAEANADFQVRWTYDDAADWAWSAGIDNFCLSHDGGGSTGPDNDLCDDAIAVDCGTTNSGDTTDATNSDAPADCDGLALNTGPGVWYSLTIPADGDYNVSIDTEGSDFDTKLGLFTGDCGALVCVASDDDGGTGLLSLIDFVGTSGETYTIYVTAFSTNSGLYDLNVSCEIIGGNDDCVATAPSNGFENGKSCTFNLARVVAHDMDVAADMDMSLETISANLFIGPEAGGINAAFVDVHVYEDNAGAPGAEIDFQAGVVPTSQTEIGANFGFQIWEVVLDITPVDLAGQAGAATTYWVGLSVEATDASNIFWENSTAGLVGNGEAYDDGAGGGFVIDTTLEGVYTFSGTCTILGTSDNTIEGFSYYPNPSTTVINVSAQDNIERVAIYNILGQKVVDQNINATSSQIDVSNLVTGAYLMDVSVNGRSATYKIIKN